MRPTRLLSWASASDNPGRKGSALIGGALANQEHEERGEHRVALLVVSYLLGHLVVAESGGASMLLGVVRSHSILKLLVREQEGLHHLWIELATAVV